uniref:non-specific serine/threonine protein kinase n=1 Tax=Kalanchoe fedtschenkoi TaxID=63787 RepID=A0A7N0VBQ5_KALFE
MSPFIGNLSFLRVINLSGNRLEGFIPKEIGLLSRLEIFNVTRNALQGGFPLQITNCTRLLTLALVHNALTGIVPDRLGSMPNLQTLFLDINNFTGQVPNSLGNILSLIQLGLSRNRFVPENNFYGNIPEGLGRLQYLERFNLGRNNLGSENGGDLDFMTNLTSLRSLVIIANRFSGMIPNSIGNLSTKIEYLSLGYNMISGHIPVGIGNLTSLITLGLEYNELIGEVPSSIGNLVMLQSLTLGGNRLQGTIPSSLGSLKNLFKLGLEENRLEGSIPLNLQHCSSLQELDLNSNKLNGTVSMELIGSLKQLIRLCLQNNYFTGKFPTSVGNLMNLNVLNISYNKFSGEIPTELVSIFFGFVLASTLTWVVCRKVSKGNDAQTISLMDGAQYLRLSYKQLRDATNGFSAANIIGVGNFGSVYSGALGDKPIAVKVMNLEKHGALKSFKAECKVLSKIRHRNLLQILSCCSSLDYKGSDFVALVYELMPNGSLESWLHGLRILNLSQRLDVAIDITSALEYLHHDCEPQIVHCDLKPSNVLLDGDMVARVGDFRLARILRGRVSDKLSQEQSMSSIGIRGTVGYVPPEYGMGANMSIEGDVYSFGILLLEMVTGRRPTDEIFNANTSLHNFCKFRAANSNISDIVDSHLLVELYTENDYHETDQEDMSMHDCLGAVIEVGVACSVDSPNERMNIREALKVLRNIKIKFPERRVGVHRQNAHPPPDEERPLTDDD